MPVRYNKHNLAVAKIAAKEGMEEYKAVSFTPEHTIATDGFRAVKVTVPKSEGVMNDVVKPIEASDQVLVPREVVADIKLPKFNKEAPGNDAVYITKQDKESVVLTTFDIETGAKKNSEAKEVPGNKNLFGGAEDIIFDAKQEKGTTVRINIQYLIDALKIAKGLAYYVDIQVPHKKGKAVYLTNKGGDDQKLEALVMPINID